MKKNIIIIMFIIFLFSTTVYGAVPAWDIPFGGVGNDSAASVQQTSDGGYIFAGTTFSYSAGGSDIWVLKTDSKGTRLWDTTFGGKDNDEAKSIRQTSDGGYVIIGTTFSYGAGGSDIWLLRIDSKGNKIWDETFGGVDNDSAASIQQTSDGGYIVAGTTSTFGSGGSDIWLLKTDANGIKLWDKTFGGADNEFAASVQQISDGGYIIAGTTSTYSAGGSDIWLVRTDANGIRLWDKPFGGRGDESAASVQQISDGGYIIAGTTSSYGAGGSDIWLVRTDANGTRLWDKPFGGAGNETASSVQQTYDDGYIIAGATSSYGSGGSDAWLLKTDAKGNWQWDKPFGGIGNETAPSVQQTYDDGYIIAGATFSYGSGGSDAWLLKEDQNGIRFWDRTFGGVGNESAASMRQISDGGYIIAGTTSSYGAGGSDIWLLRTDVNGTRLWDRTFGGVSNEFAASVQQTLDGGYIIAGITSSYGAGGSDIWLLKTDANGTRLWDRTFGGTGNESAASIQQTSDDGYIIAGTTFTYSVGGSDIWLIKTDAEGNYQWDKPFGGAGNEMAISAQQILDGGYIIAGTTSSYGAGGSDIWLLKTDANGTRLWDRTFGREGNELAASVQQTYDGGYIIAGTASAYSARGLNAWLLKTDVRGNRLWDKTFDGTGNESAVSVQQVSNGGYMIAGTTSSHSAGGSDIWLFHVQEDTSTIAKSATTALSTATDKSTQGFDIVITLAGLLAVAIRLKKRL